MTNNPTITEGTNFEIYYIGAGFEENPGTIGDDYVPKLYVDGISFDGVWTKNGNNFIFTDEQNQKFTFNIQHYHSSPDNTVSFEIVSSGSGDEPSQTYTNADPLTFIITSAGNICCTSSTMSNYEYNKNDTGWTTITSTIAVTTGDIVQFRGTCVKYNTLKFTDSTCGFTLAGNLLSIYDKTNYASIITISVVEAFNGLFKNCTGLTDASQLILQATTLTNYCYHEMFYGCTSLTTAPELPATSISGSSIYARMFMNCSSLNYVKCLLVHNTVTQYSNTDSWMSGVAATGTFVKAPSASWNIGSSGIPTGWTVEDVPVPAVKFTAKQVNSTIGLSKKSSNQTLEYSTDGETWNSMTTSTTITLVNSGDSVYVRGLLRDNNDTALYTNFKMTGNIKASGNINYLWDRDNPDTALKAFCGYGLFYGCTALTDISELELPATTLAFSCYRTMFNGCTSLNTVPVLPATTLANYCYQDMFKNCTSLTTAPELPATTLTEGCYKYMFIGCANLNYIKCLATNKSAIDCTKNWVDGVAATGTFVKDASMTGWTVDSVNGIPTGWVVEDNPVPLQSISISGETNVENSATYTVSYTPSDTTETGVTWSIVSGSEYATIDSSTGVLTALDGASSSTVAIRAISTNNTSITAEKSISVTYVSETLFDDAVLHVPFKENQSVTDVNSGILPSKNTGEITSNGYYTNGTSDICLEYTDSRLFSAFDNDFTMYFELTPYNLNRNQYLFQIKIEYYFIGLFIYYSVNNRFSVTLSNDTWDPTYYDDEIPNSPIVNYGTTYKICFKGGKNSYLDVFINGVKYTINRTYTSHSPFTVFRIGGNWNASRFSKTDFIDFAVWNKKLTDDECTQLTTI